MKQFGKISVLFKGMTESVQRFPLTMIFLVVAAVINSIGINTNKDFSLNFLNFLTGAMLAAVAEMLFERYSKQLRTRLLFMGAAAVLAGIQYFFFTTLPTGSSETDIRMSIMIFALLIAFLLAPVARTSFSFNKSFLIGFKSFFVSLLYSAVGMGGISLVLAAFDRLLIPLPEEIYSHVANIIFVLLMPVIFLSLIPVYPSQKYYAGEQTEEESAKAEIAEKAAVSPRFLVILLSRIVIPLHMIYTVILVAYILLNIGSKFWNDNLLEPLLVSYSISGILLFILAENIPGKVSVYFRRIMPKVLVPIVLFQVAASILAIGGMGITHMRYFVIVYGIYAAISGILMSVFPSGKNEWIAGLLIVFLLGSVIPPVDAFTVSRNSQLSVLESTLTRNEMLKNNTISPSTAVSDKDKLIISNTVGYLSDMGYMKKTGLVPETFDIYTDFYTTFGFQQYSEPVNAGESIYLSLAENATMPVSGYDNFVGPVRINLPVTQNNAKIATIVKEGKEYFLTREMKNGEIEIVLEGADRNELIRFHISDILKAFEGYSGRKDTLPIEQAVFSTDNERAKMTVLIDEIGIDQSGKSKYGNLELRFFIQIK